MRIEINRSKRGEDYFTEITETENSVRKHYSFSSKELNKHKVDTTDCQLIAMLGMCKQFNMIDQQFESKKIYLVDTTRFVFFSVFYIGDTLFMTPSGRTISFRHDKIITFTSMSEADIFCEKVEKYHRLHQDMENGKVSENEVKAYRMKLGF